MTYLRFFFGTVSLFLAAVAAFNFVVDSAGIYRDFRIDPQSYVNALIKSEHGLWIPDESMDNRLYAKAMTSHLQSADCVAIGSSHVMQISSERPQRSLTKFCGSIINLGVSGAVIEDHITLSYLALQHARPKRIILGVDPWIFAFGKDVRWQIYRDDYLQAQTAITHGKSSATDSKKMGVTNVIKIANLINREYTIRSAQYAAKY